MAVKGRFVALVWSLVLWWCGLWFWRGAVRCCVVLWACFGVWVGVCVGLAVWVAVGRVLGLWVWAWVWWQVCRLSAGGRVAGVLGCCLWSGCSGSGSVVGVLGVVAGVDVRTLKTTCVCVEDLVGVRRDLNVKRHTTLHDVSPYCIPTL